jgi:phosphopantothenoylcysteine decarboxylase/phosphopantothenate--cysteine ligase
MEHPQATLSGKKILLGVCGSIAAYKSVFLLRMLIKLGAEVKVVMTSSATTFVAPVTFATLSRYTVGVDIQNDDEWQNHVELGLWADLYIIAPATANTLSQMASGACNNILLAAYLSARCPVMIAPAMDLDMWEHHATKRNLALLENDGVQLISVGSGELASGLHGPGRMAEPEEIVAVIESFFHRDQPLSGKRILITAGPTRENLDPVRFISNHSTGKMGIALAETLAAAGAQVELVLGPTALPVPKHPNINVQPVVSALDMLAACESIFDHCDGAIFCAAVADYRPSSVADQKIKKSGEAMQIDLVKNPDIAATLGARKRTGQILVGFALETNNEEEHALKKLDAKNLDLIVLNSMRDAGAGFAGDSNKITIYGKDKKSRTFALKSKYEVADDIVKAMIPLLLT